MIFDVLRVIVPGQVDDLVTEALRQRGAEQVDGPSAPGHRHVSGVHHNRNHVLRVTT